jgi:hypothetical protein
VNASILDFGFQLPTGKVSSKFACYRPPYWPPPNDWVVSLDTAGAPASHWGDDMWDFSAWVGKPYKLDFAGGRHQRSAHPLSPQNQQVLRLLITWVMWGPRAGKSWGTLRSNFQHLRRVIALCESEGIVASDLSRFPQVIRKAPALFSNQTERNDALMLFDRIRRGANMLGVVMLDEDGLAVLSKAFCENPCKSKEDTEQTPYIPPRIWLYQNRRLRQLLDDFLSHADEVEKCYHFCVDTYADAVGSLEAALSGVRRSDSQTPFSRSNQSVDCRRFAGPFAEVAESYGIAQLLCRWIEPQKTQGLTIKALGSYLTLVQLGAIAYIANFTLQRKEEAGELRADCLVWDNDPSVGRIPIICGETTKTDPDSDARWPTSPSVEVAVKTAGMVARMRMRCAFAHPDSVCSKYDKDNPYLYHYSFDPWSTNSRGVKPYATRPVIPSYQEFSRRFPLLFDKEELRIKEDELLLARMFTPNLSGDGKYAVGKVWPIAFHQLRRTSAVNMFASGMLSDTSIQVIMKHLTVLQSYYYGRNYSRARFNVEVETLTTAARYEVMAKQIESLVDERYVSPLGSDRKKEIIANIIADKDFKALVSAAKRGEVSFRETRLGGCTKRGICEYGGIESIARCAGGDGNKPCRDAIYDSNKRPNVERSLSHVQERLSQAQAGSPRARALEAEAQGLGKFLNATCN